MKRELFNFWCFLAALALVASAAVHLAAMLGMNLIQANVVTMVMHLLVMIPFAVGLIYANRVAPDKKEWFKVSAFAPRWLKVLSVILLVYGLASCVPKLREKGMAEKRGENYVLVNKDGVIRPLTEQEYHQRRVQTTRSLSALWMLFASVGLTFLLAGERAKTEMPAQVADSMERAGKP